MKYHLINTLDYELFGNGSGCLNSCVLRPTDAYIDCCDNYGARATIFVDTLEFDAIQRCDKTYASAETTNAITSQLQQLGHSQHNLQLHLHPQWKDANFYNHIWQLDYSLWRIGDLNYSTIDKLIKNGLKFLGQFSNKPIIAFRAGGWAIQPSSNTIKALNNNGLLIDSTVAPNLINNASGDWYDFRKSPALSFWHIQDDVCRPQGSGLLEVPITTAKIGFRKHFSAMRESKAVPGLPDGCMGTYDGPNSGLQALRGKASKVLNMGTVMLDISTLPDWALIHATQRYMKCSSEPTPVPIVTIGHNKNFTEHSRKNFNNYLRWAKAQPEIIFSDYSQWLQVYNESK